MNPTAMDLLKVEDHPANNTATVIQVKSHFRTQK